jgi:hypothetical protein
VGVGDGDQHRRRPPDGAVMAAHLQQPRGCQRGADLDPLGFGLL